MQSPGEVLQLFLNTAAFVPLSNFRGSWWCKSSLLNPGRDAQRRKLGLSWFYPQIRKYRRSLIEVLLASLVCSCLIWHSL